MTLHGNARTCLHSRLLIVERVLKQGWTVAAAAEAAGVSARTAAKWLARYRSEGREGLVDRRSAPHRIPRRTTVVEFPMLYQFLWRQILGDRLDGVKKAPRPLALSLAVVRAM